jgi:TctA family transporter
MEHFIQGAATLFSDPTGLAIFFGGLLGGMLFGAVPGINMLTLGAVILPFTAAMSPTHAIMLYSVIYCAGVFGGAITAILFNIPGSPENAPTAFDGYPLAQKGQAGKAVGAAVMCSALGGVASAVLMMSATPLIADWAVRAFGPPEIFALICFGLSVAASVGAADLWKGWLSVLLGLLIATIGSDPSDGVAFPSAPITCSPASTSSRSSWACSRSPRSSPRARRWSAAAPGGSRSASTSRRSSSSGACALRCCAPLGSASSPASCPASARRWPRS